MRTDSRCTDPSEVALDFKWIAPPRRRRHARLSLFPLLTTSIHLLIREKMHEWATSPSVSLVPQRVGRERMELPCTTDLTRGAIRDLGDGDIWDKG